MRRWVTFLRLESVTSINSLIQTFGYPRIAVMPAPGSGCPADRRKPDSIRQPNLAF